MCRAHDFETIYVVARGWVNIQLAELAVQGIVGEGLYILENAFHFRGISASRFDGYIAAMRIRRAGTQTAS
jgi:hypothetical protein